MDIGASKFQSTISILSEKQILLSSRAGMQLFSIPPASESTNVIRLRPVWSHGFESLDVYMYPNASPQEREGSNIAVLSGYHLRVFHPAKEPNEYHVTTYKLQTHDPPRVHARNCLSSRRVFFCKDNALHTCAMPFEHSQQDGHLQARQPPSEPASVQATSIIVGEARVGGKLRVQDISWDEASGRLCLLAGQHHDYDASQRFPLRIVVVDL